MTTKLVQVTDLDDISTETAAPAAPAAPAAAGVKKVDFLMDVECKALVEVISPIVEEFKIENIMKVLPKIVKHVQKYKSLSGLEKKNMIIAMLKHIVDITDGPGDDDLWDPILKRLIPSVVDTLVQIDKGKLKLNTNTKKGFIKAFFSFINVFKNCKCN